MVRFDTAGHAADSLDSHEKWVETDYEVAYNFIRDVWNSALENKIPPTVDLDYIREGKIQSIKVLRQLTGLRLKDAKDLAEAIQDACNNSPGNNSEVNDRIIRLEWEVQFAKGMIADRDKTIARQEEAISKLRTLLHSFVDRV